MGRLLAPYGIVREGQGKTFAATVSGFEYTRYQIGGTSADLGLLAELLWDDWDANAPVAAFDDDLLLSARLALNDVQDTQALLGAVIDRHDRSVAAFLEASRRLGSRLELEGRFFLDVDRANPLDTVAEDSFLTARLALNF